MSFFLASRSKYRETKAIKTLQVVNTREKLIHICEYVEYETEFKLNNKTNFWTMISQLLKNKTGCDLCKPRNIVFLLACYLLERVYLRKNELWNSNRSIQF